MSGTQATAQTSSTIMRAAQDQFMRSGGVFVATLARMRSEGLIDDGYVYREYPKDIRIVRGKITVQCSTETNKGKTLEWEEIRDDVETITVNSEEEEDRVLNGGKTAAQIEGDRQGLILQAQQRQVKYDPSWSLLRLQRELGIKVADDAPAAFDEVAELRAQVAKAEEALALRRRLAELNAELAAPEDDLTQMRDELGAAGVKVDMRWGAARLRQELERVTAPNAA